ncbi:Protein phosphatase PP2A regulatory subunit B [Ceratobasidium sp. UAMH 11750]|nr:Protein phosphatase PP2A regulatory subunit B [Ceratobasidium sp. UAMH 11750]
MPPPLVASDIIPPPSLHVGELDPSVNEAMLFKIFKMVGPVANISVCRDAVTRRSLGYAYIRYLKPTDAERALDQLNSSTIKDRTCRIMWSKHDPIPRKAGRGSIFIRNLDERIDDKALHDTFAAFGNVISCKVTIDEAGNSRGYGFVHYETAGSAETAIKAVNGILLNDRQVFVGRCISRKERLSKIDELNAQLPNVKSPDLKTIDYPDARDTSSANTQTPTERPASFVSTMNNLIVPAETASTHSLASTAPSRYLMIYLDGVAKDVSLESIIPGPNCIFPIEKEQIPVCLSNDVRAAGIRSKFQLIHAMGYFHLARRILERDIFSLNGWDLIGWSVDHNSGTTLFSITLVVQVWRKSQDDRLFKLL